jgi:predicted RNase H-like HicB family nuclease
MNLTYRVIIEPDGKGYHGFVPSLPGCHTWGKSIMATKKHLNEAIVVYLEALLQEDGVIPKDSSLESFESVDISRRPRRAGARRQYA